MLFRSPEFTITGKDKRWYERFEEEASKIADLDSLDPTGRKYENLNDLLIQKFGAYKIKLKSLMEILTGHSMGPKLETVAIKGGIPIYIINGQPYLNGGENIDLYHSLLDQLNSIRINEIKRIMLIPPGDLTYHYGSSQNRGYMVVIETYARGFRGDPDGIKTFILDGLDSPRLFYSPRYEDPSKQNFVYDGRATLYWNPSVRTNEKGQAKVEFYTGDRRTEMEVIVNGITLGSGFTGQGQKLINMEGKR